MNPLYIILGAGILIDIVNLYWYLLHIITRIRDPENVRKKYIPSTTPGFSLIFYILYTILTITFSAAKGKPLFPISTEVAVGLICMIGHIVLHITFISILWRMNPKIRGEGKDREP